MARAAHDPATASAGDAACPSHPTFRRTIDPADPARAIATEWLLTDGHGGFAMGTVAGVPTRRYHALLVIARTPPVRRVAALAHVADSIEVDPDTPGARRCDLATFRFASGTLHPQGLGALRAFEKDLTARWLYEAGPVRVERELALLPAGVCALRYRIDHPTHAVRLRVRPLVRLADVHRLLREHDARTRLHAADDGGRLVVTGGDHDATLHLAAAGGTLRLDPQWWRDFRYDEELARHQDAIEDLFSPGELVAEIDAAGRARHSVVTLYASLAPLPPAWPAVHETLNVRRTTRARMCAAALERAGSRPGDHEHDGVVRALTAAADDFVVRRETPSGSAPTVIAGYPWFTDWGRDTMIGLPGLLVVTGRLVEARETLRLFAAHVRDGLIPNVFDDRSGDPHYNTVDASLWFLHAACAWHRAAEPDAPLDPVLRHAALAIVDAYTRGTLFDIAVDPADGLVRAGNAHTQLTWMDAQRDGVTFTPRHGKAVEINALWHHGLVALAQALAAHDPLRAESLRTAAARVRASFRALFWDDGHERLYDTLVPDGDGWRPVPEHRPNQLFAVSLPHSPLTRAQQRSVVRAVREQLATPHAVRTLDPASPGYRGRYEGSMFERDRAYHNGTAWPWLMGPLAEAVLRSEQFAPSARRDALALLAPLLRRLDGECTGQLPEVFDGDDTADRPQRPGGCPAQAWSVAEVLRAYLLAVGPADDPHA